MYHEFMCHGFPADPSTRKRSPTRQQEHQRGPQEGPKSTNFYDLRPSINVDPWLGLSWAPFCLPQAPRSSAGPCKTRCFCISTEVPMQKRRVLGGPAEDRGAWGRQKGAQDSPNHVDVNRRPQIVKVDKTSSLWGAGGTGQVPVGGGHQLR